MNYQEAKIVKANLEKEVEVTGSVMQKFPKGAMGLTPDNVKASVEFKTAKRAFDVAFSNLRNFNGQFVKVFKKEIAQERKIKYATV